MQHKPEISHVWPLGLALIKAEVESIEKHSVGIVLALMERELQQTAGLPAGISQTIVQNMKQILAQDNRSDMRKKSNAPEANPAVINNEPLPEDEIVSNSLVLGSYSQLDDGFGQLITFMELLWPVDRDADGAGTDLDDHVAQELKKEQERAKKIPPEKQPPKRLKFKSPSSSILQQPQAQPKAMGRSQSVAVLNSRRVEEGTLSDDAITNQHQEKSLVVLSTKRAKEEKHGEMDVQHHNWRQTRIAQQRNKTKLKKSSAAGQYLYRVKHGAASRIGTTKGNVKGANGVPSEVQEKKASKQPHTKSPSSLKRQVETRPGVVNTSISVGESTTAPKDQAESAPSPPRRIKRTPGPAEGAKARHYLYRVKAGTAKRVDESKETNPDGTPQKATKAQATAAMGQLQQQRIRGLRTMETRVALKHRDKALV